MEWVLWNWNLLSSSNVHVSVAVVLIAFSLQRIRLKYLTNYKAKTVTLRRFLVGAHNFSCFVFFCFSLLRSNIWTVRSRLRMENYIQGILRFWSVDDFRHWTLLCKKNGKYKKCAINKCKACRLVTYKKIVSRTFVVNSTN